jgi:hypothetical protein
VADITARFRLDISGIDAALTRIAVATTAVRGAFAAANTALTPFAGAFSAIKGSLDLGGQLSDVSAQTGIAVADLVVLRQAFENAGLGADGVGPAINRLQKALGGINEDGEPTNKALAALGISMAELESLNPTEQFARVSAAIAGIPDTTERAATAMGIFGRKGAAMMALFNDSSALDVARQQVGGLADTMGANASRFDAISDALGAANLKGQQLAAGFTAAIAPALEEVGNALNATDLTGLGESLGEMAASAIRLGQALAGMIPQILGVVAAMVLYRAGFDAKVVTAMSNIGPAASRAFAQVRVAMATMNFSSVGTAARTAFAGIGIAARGAAVAIKGALISTGIGLLIVGIATAVEAVIGKISRAKEAVRAVSSASTETSKAVRSLAGEYKNVSSEADKVALGKRIEQEIESAKESLAGLDDQFENLTPEQRDDIAANYRIEIGLLEKMRANMAKLPPEVMAHRQAEKDRAAALEESQRKAAGLNAELGKNKEALDKKITDAAFGDLSATDQQDVTLAQVDASSTADVDSQIALLAAKRESAALTTDEMARMQSLIDAREKLIGIERELGREREQAAKKAEEDAKKEAEAVEKRAEFTREVNREIARAQAEASGDKETVKRIDRETRVEQETKQGISAGLEPKEAARLANEKVGALDSVTTVQKDEQNRQTLAALDLETRLAEAKAAGNKEEAERIEWLQKYNSELARLREAMPEEDAQAAAARLVNAQMAGEPQSSAPQERSGALYASSMARIGAGGNFVSSGSDPILTENRRQTSILERIARAVSRQGTQTEQTYTLA